MDRERLERLARRNFGVFTRAQATECGYSRFQIRHRLQCGDWQVVLGTALAQTGLKITARIRDRAAQLCVPTSVLAGASAARSGPLQVPDQRTFLYVGPHGRARLPGVVAIHSWPARNDVVLFQGLPAVTCACAVVEAVQHLRDKDAIDLLDRAFARGTPSFAEFCRRVDARKGSPGCRRLGRLRDHMAGGERSVLERRATSLLKATGIVGWQTNVPISDSEGVIGLGDIVFRRERLVLELDGWAHHSAAGDRYEGDRRRQNRLTKAGWEVARYTWRQVTEQPDYLITDVQDRLARWRSSDRTSSLTARPVG